jgi:hypothetical protein
MQPAHRDEHIIAFDLLVFYTLLVERYVNDWTTLEEPEIRLFFQAFMEGVGTQLGQFVPAPVATQFAGYYRARTAKFREYELTLPLGDSPLQSGDEPFVARDMVEFVADLAAQTALGDEQDRSGLRLVLLTDILGSLESVGFADAFMRLGVRAHRLLPDDR